MDKNEEKPDYIKTLQTDLKDKNKELEVTNKFLSRYKIVLYVAFITSIVFFFPTLGRWYVIFNNWEKEECSSCYLNRPCAFGHGIVGIQECDSTLFGERLYWQECKPDPSFKITGFR